MSRKILFRGKRVDNGEWVEGYLCKRKYYCLDNRVDAFQTVIMTEFSSGGYVCFIVQENTVCQYTGLTDKNGKKIWENDIVKDDVVFGTVVWDEHEAGFVIDDVDDGHQIYADWWHGVEVIGNIFDNPWLLEAGHEQEEK